MLISRYIAGEVATFMEKLFKPTVCLCMSLLLLAIILSPFGISQAKNKETIGVEEKSGIDQVGPPWLNEDWQYRRPVDISTISVYLSYYQLLIRLDESNFDFAHTMADGSDVRFTDSSGRTLISYWIESWDYQNQIAYVWVLVSSIPPGPYHTTIYLYYNNPNAVSSSNGVATFDYFDDFTEFSGIECSLNSIPQNFQPFSILQERLDRSGDTNNQRVLVDPWCILNGTPSANSSILTLNKSTGVRSNYFFQYQAVGYRANYGLGTGHEWIGFVNGNTGPRTMIGDLPGDPDGLYLMNFTNDNSAPLGINDWHNAYHVYEVQWNHDTSRAYLDHTDQASNATQVPNGLLPVTLYNDDMGLSTTLKLDWLYVRQYRDPEPTYTIGVEQGLVDLQINTVDFPDPLPANAELTYLLTISNNSEINATDVIVTDTLPASVDFVSVSPDQDCGLSGNEIVCNLSLIMANSFASVTISGKPTMDGEITNNAFASSFGYDLDLSNNFSERTTLVDSVVPTATWVLPITDGLIYYSSGGPVTLKVLATDNDQIDRVEFWWYNNDYFLIDKVTTSPYQTSFNTFLLDPGKEYFFEVRAYDRAGNSNFPNHRAYVYIRREISTNLPVILK